MYHCWVQGHCECVFVCSHVCVCVSDSKREWAGMISVALNNRMSERGNVWHLSPVLSCVCMCVCACAVSWGNRMCFLVQSPNVVTDWENKDNACSNEVSQSVDRYSPSPCLTDPDCCDGQILVQPSRPPRIEHGLSGRPLPCRLIIVKVNRQHSHIFFFHQWIDRT